MKPEEAVGYYHSLERFGIRPGLERIRALCALLGDPQKRFACVHVAGTNGKGSTCTELASILTAAGYQTGLYTSPYVIEFRERIRLNGEMIPWEALCRVTQTVKTAIETLAEQDVAVTEFEAVTAAAFLYYAECGCDIVVLETGLGGRFDATNVVEAPLCSVITSVSLDHTKILGDTVEQIAAEKCGIIKPGCPVVTGAEQLPPVLDVIRRTAKQQGSELMIAEAAELVQKRSDITGADVRWQGVELHVPFCGAHQICNTALVLNAVKVLRREGYRIDDGQIAKGLSAASIPARIEIINRSPLVILDGSHNDGSTAALANALMEYLPGKRILAVMGMMADKDCEKALEHLLPLFSKVIAVRPSNPRSMGAEHFRDLVLQKGVAAQAAASPEEGVREAIRQLDGYDALVACGSLYLAADIRAYLLQYFSKDNRREQTCQ